MRTIEVNEPTSGGTNGAAGSGGQPPKKEHKGGGGGRDNLLVGVYALAAMAVIASLVAVGLGVRAIDEAGKKGTVAAAAKETTPSTGIVVLSDLKITPAALSVAQGGKLEVTNNGAIQHDLAVDGTNLVTPMLDAGAKATLDLSSLAPGNYTVYCQVAGHRAAGMESKLTIVAGAARTEASGTTATTAAPMTPEQMDATMAARTKAFPAKTEGLGAQDLAPTVLADGTKQFEVTAKVVKWELEPGKFVDAWTYNGTVPAPTIRVNPGDKVKVVLHNELPESTALHFHGITTPNGMDGVPDVTQPPIKPGQTYTYAFTAQSTPAVGMYHSHHDAQKQVPNGLAGAFLIGQEPLPAGVTVSQQQIMMLNDSGTLGYSINGKSFPATAPIVAKQGDWIQVQYLNEGATLHPMHLHGMTQTVIAKDGLPLANPEVEDTVVVAPGERYTVLVHATELGTWAWHCHILPHAENDQGMFGMVTALVVS
ncbi:MAG TPA: multicopper oxidase domain-containing protein [Acidimicrobiales bacterium]|nr:multicopper oxidase domain-containing protein [Acidimicrobiales bacterium]